MAASAFAAALRGSSAPSLQAVERYLQTLATGSAAQVAQFLNSFGFPPSVAGGTEVEWSVALVCYFMRVTFGLQELFTPFKEAQSSGTRELIAMCESGLIEELTTRVFTAQTMGQEEWTDEDALRSAGTS